MPALGLRLTAEWTPNVPTDETDFIREERRIAVRRGRQNQLSRTNAGTLDVAVDNRKAPNQRRFDPDNAASPLFGKLLPGVKTQLLMDYPYLPGLLTDPDFELGGASWAQQGGTKSIVTASPFNGKQNMRVTATIAKRTVADGVTNGTTTVTSATAAFTANDVGSRVTGTNIQANSYIVQVTNGTTIVLSRAASGSGSGLSLTFLPDAGVTSAATPAKVGDIVDVAFRCRYISAGANCQPIFATTWYSDTAGTTFISRVYSASPSTFGSSSGWVRQGGSTMLLGQTAPATTQSFRVSVFNSGNISPAGGVVEFDAVVADNVTVNGITPLYTGYLDKLPQDGDDTRDGWVQLGATDAGKKLGRIRLTRSGVKRSFTNDVNLPTYQHGWSFGDDPRGVSCADDLGNTVSTEGATPLILFGSGVSLGARSLIPMEQSTCLKTTDAWSGAHYPAATGPGSDVGSAVEAWVSWGAQNLNGLFTGLLFNWWCQWHPGAAGTAAEEWIIGANTLGDLKFRAGTKNWTWLQTATGFKLDGTLNHVVLVAPAPSGTAPYMIVNGVTYAASSGSAGGPATPTHGASSDLIIGGMPSHITSNVVVGWIGTIQFLAISTANLPDYTSRYIAGSGWGNEASGARLNRVLDIAGWDASLRSIDTGAQTIPPIVDATYRGAYAQAYIDVVADSEFARQFINRGGSVRYINRRAPAVTPYNTVQATFGSGTGEIPFSSAKPLLDDQLIFTEAVITRNGGTAQAVANAAGVTQFGYITMSRSIECLNDGEAATYAQAMTQQYGTATPPRRIEAVTWKPTTDAGFAELYNREIGDLIAVRVRPPGITPGTYVEYKVFVEGISVDATQGVTVVTYQVSGYGVQPGWLVLNDANLGKLNTGKLGF